MTPEEREFEVEHMIAARDQGIQDLASHDLCGTGGRLTVASPRADSLAITEAEICCRVNQRQMRAEGISRRAPILSEFAHLPASVQIESELRAYVR